MEPKTDRNPFIHMNTLWTTFLISSFTTLTQFLSSEYIWKKKARGKSWSFASFWSKQGLASILAQLLSIAALIIYFLKSFFNFSLRWTNFPTLDEFCNFSVNYDEQIFTTFPLQLGTRKIATFDEKYARRGLRSTGVVCMWARHLSGFLLAVTHSQRRRLY